MQTGGFPPAHHHTAEDTADVKGGAATCEALNVLAHLLLSACSLRSLFSKIFHGHVIFGFLLRSEILQKSELHSDQGWFRFVVLSRVLWCDCEGLTIQK